MERKTWLSMTTQRCLAGNFQGNSQCTVAQTYCNSESMQASKQTAGFKQIQQVK
jgi:hypothetical protein